MGPKQYVMGLFKDESEAAETVKALQDSPFQIETIHSPIPSHTLDDALQAKKSRVGWYTLCGGIIGFFSGFLLAAYASVQWNLIVGGKPIVALVPFVIVGFEFTILFAVFGNVAGLIAETCLPDYKGLEHHDPLCTGDNFGIVAACEKDQKQALMDMFSARGARVKVFS